jgi:5'-nucleotidase
MRIGIDIDGVLYDFVSAFHAYAEQSLGRTLPKNFEKWGFFEEWGIDLPGFCKMMEEGCAAGALYHEGPLPEHAKQVIHLLEDEGHTIVFITARGEHARQATRNWLDGHGLWHHLIMGAEDKTLHQLDVLLDDGPHNIEAARAAGVRAIVFDQPWNQHVAGVRVYSWRHFHILIILLTAPWGRAKSPNTGLEISR